LKPNDPVYSGAAVCALSPSGDRIAARDGGSRFVGVWSKDGTRVAMLDTPVGARGRIRTSWVCFRDEQHLWVLSGYQLSLRELTSGKSVATVPGAVSGPTEAHTER
jgi:hypothetical protein